MRSRVKLAPQRTLKTVPETQPPRDRDEGGESGVFYSLYYSEILEKSPLQMSYT